MILKGNVRGGSKQLGTHLTNTKQNDHVDVHEVRGFISEDIHGAMLETYAISKATRCKKFIYSLSLNPPEDAQVSIGKFEDAINRAEKRLGLDNQPRVIVFHEKEGRRHAHAVWSRIDTDEMKAIRLSHDHFKLNDLSKSLFLEHGWKLPDGYIDKSRKNPLNFTRAEWQQALRTRQFPKDIKRDLQECWAISDSKGAFEHALKDKGYRLARGDRRSYVAVDLYGEIYSLSRQTGQKKKDLEARLGKAEALQSVPSTKKEIGGRLVQLFQTYADKLNQKHEAERSPLLATKAAMIERQRAGRAKQSARHKARWQKEELQRSLHLRKGFKGIWDRLTGSYKKTRAKNEKETLEKAARDRAENEKLVATQLLERQKLQTKLQQLRQSHRKENLNLIKDVNTHFKKVDYGDRKKEIRELFEQEKRRRGQDREPDNGPTHEPEM